MVVRHLQGKQTNLAEIFDKLNPYAPNHVEALQNPMTVDRLRGIIDGRKVKNIEVIGEDNEEFETGKIYTFEDGSKLSYLAQVKGADVLTTKLYGAERATLLRIMIIPSEKSKREDHYDFITAPIQLDHSDAQTFNGNEPTLVHSVIVDGKTTDVTLYKLGQPQKLAGMISEELAKYTKDLEPEEDSQ